MWVSGKHLNSSLHTKAELQPSKPSSSHGPSLIHSSFLRPSTVQAYCRHVGTKLNLSNTYWSSRHLEYSADDTENWVSRQHVTQAVTDTLSRAKQSSAEDLGMEPRRQGLPEEVSGALRTGFLRITDSRDAGVRSDDLKVRQVKSWRRVVWTRSRGQFHLISSVCPGRV